MAGPQLILYLFLSSNSNAKKDNNHIWQRKRKIGIEGSWETWNILTNKKSELRESWEERSSLSDSTRTSSIIGKHRRNKKKKGQKYKKKISQTRSHSPTSPYVRTIGEKPLGECYKYCTRFQLFSHETHPLHQRIIKTSWICKYDVTIRPIKF